MRSVLGQPTKPDFAKPELTLDDSERMLNFGPKAGFGPLNFLHQTINGAVAQGTPLSGAPRNVPGHITPLVFGPLVHALVTGIAVASGMEYRILKSSDADKRQFRVLL